jgi:hypothetical protein
MNIDLNPLGLVAAATAFLSIWLGHVSVRKVEARTLHLWVPIAIAVLIGLLLEFAALMSDNRLLSTVFGILGITILWDALEIRRQAKRVRKGHAPANPHNPRHAALLADPRSPATVLDLLNRDPVERAVEMEEAVRLVTKRGETKSA